MVIISTRAVEVSIQAVSPRVELGRRRRRRRVFGQAVPAKPTMTAATAATTASSENDPVAARSCLRRAIL